MNQTSVPSAPVPPDVVAEAQQAFQEWQAGNQAGALERLRPRADRGELWAVSLTVWFYIQQGAPSYRLAVPYAEKAQSLGMPWVASTLVNHMVGQIPNDPSLLDELIAIVTPFPLLAFGFDPMGNGWNFLSKGQTESAIRILSMTALYPSDAAGWTQLADQARSQIQHINQTVTIAQTAVSEVQAKSQESIAAIEQRRQDMETAANQANILLSSVNAGAVNTLFKEDADRRAGESQTSWRWGISVLASAAAVAVLPLTLHYLGAGPELSSTGLLAAHAASTVALATIAGVLLSRARGRDNASQRASDLSTAMGTMITYSNQISDPADKQKFMLTMGQLVLQAHLQTDAAGKDESLTGLATLVSAIRGPNAS